MMPLIASDSSSLILEQTSTRRMVWVDVARVVACILIIANHMAFYSAELYRWIWVEFLAARTPFFLLVAGYFVGCGTFGSLEDGRFFLWKRSWFLLRPYLVWGIVSIVLIGWSPLHEYAASYRPLYEWIRGEAGSSFWPALAAFGRCLGIAGHPVDAPMWFLRDIIIYTTVAPLLYRLKDYLLWVGLMMLSLNYFALDLVDHDYPIANSLGFFMLGMFISRFSLPFLTEAVRRYAVPFLLATLVLTWWLVEHRDQHNSMLIALGMLGLMSLAILFTEWFPRVAKWVAGLAPACFFIFGTHYIVIILLRESGWIPWTGVEWDIFWLCLAPCIFAVLAGLFFCMKRWLPKLVPLLGAYRIRM